MGTGVRCVVTNGNERSGGERTAVGADTELYYRTRHLNHMRCYKPVTPVSPQLKRKLPLTSLTTQLGLVPPGHLAECVTLSTLLVCASRPSPAEW